MGFAFIGSNYHLAVGNQDFYLDLLFYHVNLQCFVVIELKIGEFLPEYAGKMNFYLKAVDEQLKRPDDKPTIGIILCRESGDKVVAEYALSDMKKPIGVASYQFTKSLPEPLQKQLPDVKSLEESVKDLSERLENVKKSLEE